MGIINFSFNDIPNASEFSALYSMYRIDKVEVTWFPEYTVLSDSGLASTAQNVLLNTAYEPNQAIVPTTVADVLQYQTLKSTGITKEHTRSIVPMYAVDNVNPCSCFLTTTSGSLNLFGIVFGVAPTGTSMVLRSRAKFYLSMKSVR